MWEAIASFSKYLQSRPEVLALLLVVGILCSLLVLTTKALVKSLDKISASQVILAELTALVKSLVYGREKP